MNVSEGLVRVLLGLQLPGGSGGPDEEEDGRSGSAEPAELGGLQQPRGEPGLQRRIHLQVLQLHHPQQRRRLGEFLPLRAQGYRQHDNIYSWK